MARVRSSQSVSYLEAVRRDKGLARVYNRACISERFSNEGSWCILHVKNGGLYIVYAMVINCTVQTWNTSEKSVASLWAYAEHLFYLFYLHYSREMSSHPVEEWSALTCPWASRDVIWFEGVTEGVRWFKMCIFVSSFYRFLPPYSRWQKYTQSVVVRPINLEEGQDIF